MSETAVSDMSALRESFVQSALSARKVILKDLNIGQRPGRRITRWPKKVQLDPTITLKHAREVKITRLHASLDTYWHTMFTTIQNQSTDDNIAENSKTYLQTLRHIDLLKFREENNETALHIVGLLDLSNKLRSLLLGLTWVRADMYLPPNWRAGLTEVACLLDKQTVTDALDIARLSIEADEVRRLAEGDAVDLLCISRDVLRELITKES